MIKFLQTLRILDADGNLSLTNLSVIATAVNLLYCQDVSIEALGAFLASVIGYNVKRFAKAPAAPVATDIEELREALQKLETSVTAVKMANSPTRRR